MKRRTTTVQINEALTTNLLTVTKVECYHKTSRQTDHINPESFIEYFQFLCESNVFMDCVGWIYQQDHKTGEYVLESGRSDGDSENIITVFLSVNDGVRDEDIRDILTFTENGQD